MKEFALLAVPLAMLALYFSMIFFDLPLPHPLLYELFIPLNYVVALVAVATLMLTIGTVSQLRQKEPAEISHNPIAPKELEEIRASIAQLQEDMRDLKALSQFSERKEPSQDA